jgi:hypothetical protein
MLKKTDSAPWKSRVVTFSVVRLIVTFLDQVPEVRKNIVLAPYHRHDCAPPIQA